MTVDRPAPEPDETDPDGPGSDPGAAYEKAMGEEATLEEEPSPPPEPGVGDVYRSGS